MTTNIDRAAEVIEDWVAREWGSPEDNATAAASDLAEIVGVYTTTTTTQEQDQ